MKTKMKMKKHVMLSVVTVMLGMAVTSCAATSKPNIVFALVDDLGSFNVGWTNPNQASPRLKSLLETEGARLNRAYTYLYCSPTRSSFLSGRFPIHVNEENPPGVGTKGGIDLRMTLLPAKLKTLGYKTAMVGKGHIGARSAANLPVNRGFDHHFGFLSGGEDHMTQRSYETKNYVDLWSQTAPAYGKNGTYSCDLYTDDALNVINDHDTSAPLFMYLAHHDVHSPYETTAKWTNNTISSCYRRISGMMECVDSRLGDVIDALKAKGMWENTLFIFSSDNGGPQYWEGNNHPFRGGKGTDFEGGTRVAAFVAGGVLPTSLRGNGAVIDDPIHVADWYTTFCRMGGGSADFCKDDVTGLPGVDGVDVTPLLQAPGQTLGPRPIILSSGSWFNGSWKYVAASRQVLGVWSGYWTGPDWPPKFANGSCSHVPLEADPLCPAGGCLFNVVEDPTEHKEVSAQYPALAASMRAFLQEAVKGKYQTFNYTGGYDTCEELKDYADAHHGFAGPLCVK